MAAWVDVAYNLGNFEAFTVNGSQAWTVESGDVTTLAYRYIGKTMQVAFVISGTSVLSQGGSTPSALLLTIPQGRRATRAVVTPIRVLDNGTYGVGYASVGASGNEINCFLSSGSWAASTNNSGVWGQIEFEVDAVNDAFTATGGTITTANGYTRHTFTGTGSFVVTQGQATSVDYLIVGGGGGGGGDDVAGAGGGGGGGQVQIGSVVVVPGTYTVTVGNGGAAGLKSATGDGGTGGSSSFYGVTAAGGSGGGAGAAGGTPRDGIDGTIGGGAGDNAVGGDGSAFDGGGGAANAGGGGAGADGNGAAASSGVGGAGGNGRMWTPNSTRYGGGGGGGGNPTGGAGTDGGGDGRSGTGAGSAGTANRGGGGGGARFGAVGGAGGSGIVIVQYPTP